MPKNLFSNFSRNDLNLGDRWWHRLLLVIFFASFAWVLYVTYNGVSSTYIPQWKVVSSVDERITNDVKQIRDLTRPGEKVEERDRSYALNFSADYSLYADFYCSNDLENKILEVQNKSGITNLYIRKIYDRSNVPAETFANYVRDNDIKCLIPDAYTYQDSFKVSFLEPIEKDSIFGEDLVFYEKSNLLTGLYVLKVFSLVVVVFASIAAVYYKIFLYIIFGKRK